MEFGGIHENVLECIGGTPLVRLNNVVDGARTPVLAKCEFMNPGSSVKDRIGLAIILDAEKEGLIQPGGTIVEATSGNTGVGLSLAAAVKGYRCVFTIPDKMSMEKVKLLKAFGAEVIVTPTVPPDHPEYFVTVAQNIVDSTENSFLANQFYNQINPECHYQVTGPELWEQTAGRMNCIVGGLGTGGTLSGVGKYLKEKTPDILIIGADPVGSVYRRFKETGEVIEGEVYKVEGIGQDKIPDTAWLEFIDEFREVTDRESFNMARRLAREEALFCGGSSGTAARVAVDMAHELDDPDKVIIVFLTDTGERYLSKCHSDEWMRENRFLDEPTTDVGKMLLMKDHVSESLVSVTSTCTVKQALGLMQRDNVSQVPVIEKDECIGSVSESQLMSRVLQKDVTLDNSVTSAMEAPFPVIGESENIEYVTRLLGKENSALLVRTGTEITGILTRYDIVHSMTR